jgi:hypothetical protein
MTGLAVTMIFTGLICLVRVAIGRDYERRDRARELEGHPYAQARESFFRPMFWRRAAVVSFSAGAFFAILAVLRV